MNIELYITGMVIGLMASAPVGPVNVMAIRRAAHYGFLPGFIAGMGAVLADGVFALGAAFGVTTIAEFVERNEIPIQSIGGLLLILFGISVFRSHPHLKGGSDGGPSSWRGLAASFAMTITNPGAILGFIAIFGSLGQRAPAPGDYIGALALVAGVLTGALCWWAGLSATISKLRNRLNDDVLSAINHVAGIVLLVFAAVILMRVLKLLFW